MKHNDRISEDVREANISFNRAWILERGLIGAELIGTDDLDVDEARKRDASPFMVVWLRNIERLCNLLDDDFDYRSHSLIDVGCGSGISTLYFYQKYDFQSFDGFDFSKRLIALANINKALTAAYRKKTTPVSFQLADAKEFRLPHRPHVIFMFNPFGWETMKAFVENNIHSMRETKSIILYANDLHLDGLRSYGTIVRRDDFYNLSAIKFVN